MGTPRRTWDEEGIMGRRLLPSILAAALVLPLGAQTPGGVAEGTPLTVAGVHATAVNRPGRVTTAVKLREKPSTSAAVIEYWSTTTQREPELFLPVGGTVLVAARTVEKEKVGTGPTTGIGSSSARRSRAGYRPGRMGSSYSS